MATAHFDTERGALEHLTSIPGPKMPDIQRRVTSCGIFLIVYLIFWETLSFFTQSVRQEYIIAPASTERVRVTFNVSFPRLPCDVASLEVENAVGQRAHNVTTNIARFKLDAATGRALLLVGESADARYEEEEGDWSHDREVAENDTLIHQLDESSFPRFVAQHRLALIAYGAPWCPYSRRLAPVFDEVSLVVGFNDEIRLGRVDCTEETAASLCKEVKGYPTILLHKDGAVHSDINFKGDRSRDAILNFLVVAQQDDSLTSSETHTDDGEAHADAIQRSLGLLPPLDDGTDGSDKHAATATSRDPADPGRAARLIEAMHKIGLAAPGDAARAALKAAAGQLGLVTPAATPSGAVDLPGSCPEGAVAKGVEGCRFAGYVEVARVPGVLRFGALSNTVSIVTGKLNMSHVIHELFLGPQLSSFQLSRLPRGVDAEMHALRNHVFVSQHNNATHAHYVSVVPSSFTFSTRHSVATYRYGANSHAFVDETRDAPEARFAFDFSPLTLVTVEEYPSFFSQHAIPRLLGVIGGVAVLTNVLEALLHRCIGAQKRILGKDK